jgi:hypothetical protein
MGLVSVLVGLRDDIMRLPELTTSRHCEERSDEAIHAEAAKEWIASLRSQ